MKKINLLIWTYLILGCSNSLEIIEPEIGYIDYSNYPQEKLTQNDRTLLENINFQEGKLISLLNLKSALEQGIPKEKYSHFLQYLQNENQKIENYLDSGAIVFYNGEGFTRNEKLYQYVENTKQPLAKATYSQSTLLYTHEHSGSFNFYKEYSANFNGTSRISVNYHGPNSVYIKENLKRVSAYLIKGVNGSQATFDFVFRTPQQPKPTRNIQS
ncbi:hypothetical protein [Gabonibacter chumensis]|uniref:hypothetical protein n=1 Tax=Gabonibacter chumensis TaxID=2972474 RepID=UPI002574122D|nr:hypothetical protein [Gabonibacter chumensis]MCR9011143.1 hypothetical protein [Gabonibacter chumensis]